MSSHTQEPVRIGVIGGSGLYQMEDLKVIKEIEVDTPFGKPSDNLILGELETEAGTRQVVFLPRHGRGHTVNPTHIPARANIWALKSLGVFWLVSVSAVGSLKLEIEPCDFVIPDQIIDRTKSRVNTFFDEIAVHCGFSYPFHPDLAKILAQCARDESVTVHEGGTYVCMEGPLFSTIAESNMHRSWGASIIGMTALPEAKLAREAEMCYACIALATDYDVWHEDDHVSVEMVIQNLMKNTANVQRVLKRVVGSIPVGTEEQCEAYTALKNAIITRPDMIPESTRKNLGLLLDKYMS